MSVILFIGVPGAGKTQAMLDLVMEQVEKHLFFVCDRANEWNPYGEQGVRFRGKLPNPFLLIDSRTSYDDALKAFNESPIQNGLVVFQQWEPFDVATLSKEVGNNTYVDDEIDLFANYKGWNENPLRDIVHRGRHLPNANGEICKSHVFGGARRFQNLHTDLTSMADECYIFRVSGARTIDRLRNEGMLDTDEHIEIARTQPNLEFFLWKNDGTISRWKVSDPFLGK